RAEHEGIAEPEREPGYECDLGDIENTDTPLSIDTQPNNRSDDNDGAQIVADGVAREISERCNPIRYVAAADHAQGKELIESQPGVNCKNQTGRYRDFQHALRSQHRQHLVDFDIT